MTKLGDLFLIPEWTSDERDAVARLLSRLESIVLDLGQRIDTSGRVSSLSVGGGRVTTNSITFPNNREQLRFSPTTGSDYATIGSDVLKDGKEVFRINQNAVGGSIGLQAQMTSAFKRLVLHEDPALADRLQLDLQIGGAAGAKFTMGGEVEIHGGADGVTTVFNETGRDIDFRVEGDTNANAITVDGGLDLVGILRAPVSGDAALTVLGDMQASGYTGWNFANETWTYASATTFTVPTDLAAKYKKGTKIKLTQTTAKYFYVSSSSYSAPNTTVTITGGTDYTLANAAITAPFYSYADTAVGFPHLFNYAVTVTSGTGTITSYTVDIAVFSVSGLTVTVLAQITITDNGTGAQDIRFTLPIACAPSLVNGTGREDALTGNMLQVAVASPTLGLVTTYNNGYPAATNAVMRLGLTHGI